MLTQEQRRELIRKYKDYVHLATIERIALYNFANRLMEAKEKAGKLGKEVILTETALSTMIYELMTNFYKSTTERKKFVASLPLGIDFAQHAPELVVEIPFEIVDKKTSREAVSLEEVEEADCFEVSRAISLSRLSPRALCSSVF